MFSLRAGCGGLGTGKKAKIEVQSRNQVVRPCESKRNNKERRGCEATEERVRLVDARLYGRDGDRSLLLSQNMKME
jgi:hypothetical protein